MSQISTFQSQVGVPSINQPLPTGGGIAQGLSQAGQSIGRGLMDIGQAKRVEQERIRLEREQVAAVQRQNQKVRRVNDLRGKVSKLAADAAVKEDPADWFMAQADSLREGLEDIPDLGLREAVELQLDTMLTTAESRLYEVHRSTTLAQAGLSMQRAKQEQLATLGGSVVGLDGLAASINSYAEVLQGYVGNTMTQETADASLDAFRREATVAQYQALLDSGSPENAEAAAQLIESRGRSYGIGAQEVSEMAANAENRARQLNVAEAQGMAANVPDTVARVIQDVANFGRDDIAGEAQAIRETLLAHPGASGVKGIDKAVDEAARDQLEFAAEAADPISFGRAKAMLSDSLENKAAIEEQQKRLSDNLKAETDTDNQAQIIVSGAMTGENTDVQADPASRSRADKDLTNRGWTPQQRYEFWAATTQGLPESSIAEVSDMFNPSSGAFDVGAGIEALTAIARGGGNNRARQVARNTTQPDIAQVAFDMGVGASEPELQRIVATLSNERAPDFIKQGRLELSGDPGDNGAWDIEPVNVSDALADAGVGEPSGEAQQQFASAFLLEYARQAAIGAGEVGTEQQRLIATEAASQSVAGQFITPTEVFRAFTLPEAITRITPIGFMLVDNRVSVGTIRKDLISGRPGSAPSDSQSAGFAEGLSLLVAAGDGTPRLSAAFRAGGRTFVPLMDEAGVSSAYMIYSPLDGLSEIVADEARVSNFDTLMLRSTAEADRLPASQYRWRPAYGMRSAMEVDQGIVQGIQSRAAAQFEETYGRQPDVANSVEDRQQLLRMMRGESQRLGWPSLTPPGVE